MRCTCSDEKVARVPACRQCICTCIGGEFATAGRSCQSQPARRATVGLSPGHSTYAHPSRIKDAWLPRGKTPAGGTPHRSSQSLCIRVSLLGGPPSSEPHRPTSTACPGASAPVILRAVRGGCCPPVHLIRSKVPAVRRHCRATSTMTCFAGNGGTCGAVALVMSNRSRVRTCGRSL